MVFVGHFMLRDTQNYLEIDGAEIQAAPDFRICRTENQKVEHKRPTQARTGGLSVDAGIKTLLGEKRLGDLTPGDLVLTRDNGFQPVRWVGRCKAGPGSRAMVVLKADALGPGLPSRDLILSEDQRLLTSGGVLRELFSKAEMLIPTRALRQLSALCHERVDADVWHVLMQRHEVILANDVWTESFQPNRQFFDTAEEKVRRQLERFCPKLVQGDAKRAFPAARAQTHLTTRV